MLLYQVQTSSSNVLNFPHMSKLLVTKKNPSKYSKIETNRRLLFLGSVVSPYNAPSAGASSDICLRRGGSREIVDVWQAYGVPSGGPLYPLPRPNPTPPGGLSRPRILGGEAGRGGTGWTADRGGENIKCWRMAAWWSGAGRQTKALRGLLDGCSIEETLQRS